MNFQAKRIGDISSAPRATEVQVGRFQVRLDFGQTLYDAFTWNIVNADDVVRPDDQFPVTGRISQHTHPLEQIMNLLSELSRYDRHLTIEEEVAANPKKYLKIAEAEQKAEDKAQREAEEAAAEQQAAAEKAAKEAEAEAQREAEQAAEEAQKAEVARLEAEKRAKLDLRIRAAAARELGGSQHV